MSLKDRIQRKGQKRPSKTIIYGPPGTGKTSLAAQWPDPIFLCPDGEEGISFLIESGVVQETDWILSPTYQDLFKLVKELVEDDSHKTIVIDGILALESLLHHFVCETKYGGDWGPSGFQSFMVGYKTSVVELNRLLAELDKANRKGKAIILIGHSTSATYKNPMGADYGKVVFECHTRTQGALDKWADTILFYDHDVDVKKEGKTGKAKGSGDRVLRTSSDGSYIAKNRYNGLAQVIDCGSTPESAHKAFITAIRETMKSG